MFASVDRSLIVDAFKRLARTTDEKSSLQAGSYYVEVGEDRLVLSSTDTDIFTTVTIPATCKPSDPFMLPGSLALNLFLGLPDRVVMKDGEDEGVVYVESGRSKVQIRKVKGHHPILNVKPIPQSISVDMTLLGEAMQRTMVACSEAANEIIKTCLHMEQQDGVIYVDATDSYRVASSSVNGVSIGTEDRKVLLPARFVKEFLRYVGEGSTIGLGMDDKMISVYLRDMVISSRLVEASFPRVRPALSIEGRKFATMNTEALLLALKRCAAIKANTLRVRLTDGKADLISKSDYGEAHEIIDATVDSPITFWINNEFMRDALEQVTGTQVRLYYATDKEPVIVVDDNYLHGIQIFKPRA
jgi:DNA polymerase III sliding clamp (beta) subunit (PCNA family)